MKHPIGSHFQGEVPTAAALKYIYINPLLRMNAPQTQDLPAMRVRPHPEGEKWEQQDEQGNWVPADPCNRDDWSCEPHMDRGICELFFK